MVQLYQLCECSILCFIRLNKNTRVVGNITQQEVLYSKMVKVISTLVCLVQLGSHDAHGTS